LALRIFEDRRCSLLGLGAVVLALASTSLCIEHLGLGLDIGNQVLDNNTAKIHILITMLKATFAGCSGHSLCVSRVDTDQIQPDAGDQDLILFVLRTTTCTANYHVVCISVCLL